MKWPKLSESLRNQRHPHVCQSCGVVRTLDVGEGALEVWRECDEKDQLTTTVVVLCHGCAGRLIEPHPRLYHREPPNKPIPGAIPHLCATCRHRSDLACTHPALKANGGPGLMITVEPPIRGFWDGRGKDGRRTGGLIETYQRPASACAGQDAEMPHPAP
jgi:hypothetical protein